MLAFWDNIPSLEVSYVEKFSSILLKHTTFSENYIKKNFLVNKS